MVHHKQYGETSPSVTFTGRHRRLLISSTVLLFVLSFLVLSPWIPDRTRGFQQVPIPVDVARLHNASHGDGWSPPEPWDPTAPIYTDFPKIYYTASSREDKDAEVKKYNPLPDHDSSSYEEKYKGRFVSCRGPRGLRLNESAEDAVYGLIGSMNGYNEGTLGSNRELGLDQDVCFDRFGKLGAYGMPPAPGAKSTSRIDWGKIDWGQLQEECVEENQNRFDLSPRKRPDEPGYNRDGDTTTSEPQAAKRTAILLRGHMDMIFTEEIKQTIRSIVTELALASGGEYEVILFYNVKRLGRSIESLTPTEYHNLLAERIPYEFRSMTVMWNEMLWPERYPLIPPEARLVHHSQWLSVQWFAKQHPEFDHYWNWEMDVRFTGHAYDLVSKVDDWTKRQPRQGMWERNERFFIPEFHSNYSWFSDVVTSRYTDEAKTTSNSGTIWGPYPPKNQPIKPWDPLPPTSKPNPDWGVGEDADFITFLPMFDPVFTHYTNLGVWYHYDEKLRGHGGPFRRTTIVTFYRLSNRLLAMMDIENTQAPGRHMGSEQWPQAVALHHGLKAVYAPHSVYTDRIWPARAADWVFNNGDQAEILERYPDLPRTGSGSGGTESCFGLGREHNFFNTGSFYYRARLGLQMYKQWMGYEVDGVGGEEWEKNRGAYCLPPMLLHPIKLADNPADTVLDIPP